MVGPILDDYAGASNRAEFIRGTLVRNAYGHNRQNVVVNCDR